MIPIEKKPEPILVAMALLAGLDVIVAGLGLGEYVTVKTAGLLILILAGVKAATAYYLRGQVVPLGDVGAYRDEAYGMVAGPASLIPDKQSVNVVPDDA